MNSLFAIVDFVSNIVTIVLGLLALWGIVAHRGTLTELARFLHYSYLNDSFQRIRETLAKLDYLNYDDKESRREIRALLGQLNGQLKGVDPSVRTEQLLERLQTVVTNGRTLTEAVKREIVSAARGTIDASLHVNLRQLKGK